MLIYEWEDSKVFFFFFVNGERVACWIKSTQYNHERACLRQRRGVISWHATQEHSVLQPLKQFRASKQEAEREWENVSECERESEQKCCIEGCVERPAQKILISALRVSRMN